MQKSIPFSSLLFSSCCSIVIPPVTLTGEKTVIEKQILGEEREIEPDMWLLSSARTSTLEKIERELTEEERKKLFQEDYLRFQAIAILEVFEEKLALLKKDGVVGENQEGLITNLLEVEEVRKELPDKILEKYNPRYEKDPEKGKPYRMLIATVKEINRARKLLAKAYLLRKKREDPKYEAKLEDILKLFQKKNYTLASPGEYLQDPKGNWYKKP